MVRKFTTEEVVDKFKEVHGDKYLYDKVEYINAKTKVWIGCKVEGHGYFEQICSKHIIGIGCPICENNKGKNSRFKLEELKNLPHNKNIEVLDIKYVLVKNNKHQAYVEYKCLTESCGYVGSMRLGEFRFGCGCPACKGLVVTENNCISKTRPDLIKYFHNPQDADNYTAGSGKKVKTICPSCGHINNKMIQIIKLSNYEFSCPICSDGISVPEKFISNLLKNRGIEFIPQFYPKWDKLAKKYYDFYIPLLNTIIEVHGMQHYDKSRGQFIRTNLIEFENDKYKHDIAIDNGIKPENYIIIDARYSKFEWLKNSCIKGFSNHFDLSNVDWENIWLKSQNSIMKEVWDLWNDPENSYTTTEIGNVFNLTKNTIRQYLKIGNSLGICTYNPKEENRKIGVKNGKASRKIIHQFSLNDEYIQSFNSIIDASEKFGLNPSGISACANGINKTSGGFKWSFNTKNDLKILEHNVDMNHNQ